VLSLYLLFAGHNQPGGGFVGGLVAAAAFALRYVAGGLDDVIAVVKVAPWTILSVGLGLAAGSALWPVAVDRAPLDQQAVAWDLGALGSVKATTALVFDSGVFLIVVGLVLMVFEALGEDPDGTTESPGRGAR
jgi:multicomponent Na+:H+ antiporter subunit A